MTVGAVELSFTAASVRLTALVTVPPTAADPAAASAAIAGAIDAAVGATAESASSFLGHTVELPPEAAAVAAEELPSAAAIAAPSAVVGVALLLLGGLALWRKLHAPAQVDGPAQKPPPLPVGTVIGLALAPTPWSVHARWLNGSPKRATATREAEPCEL